MTSLHKNFYVIIMLSMITFSSAGGYGYVITSVGYCVCQYVF